MEHTAEQALDTPRSLRVRLGLSQRGLHKKVKAEVGLTAIRRIEAGKDVRLGAARFVAAVLGVTTGFLVDAMERRAAQLKAGPLARSRARARGGRAA